MSGVQGSVRSRTAAEPAASEGEMRGLRAGTIVFLGIAAANVGNYLFHFASARFLGPASYGDVASLVAMSGLLTLPLFGVQLAIARYVAGFHATGAETAIRALYRRGLVISLLAGAIVTALLLAIAIPVKEALGVGSLSAVLLTALIAAPAFVSPVVVGLLQGLQRFALVSLAIAVNPLIRVALAVVLLSAGLGVAGAIGATWAAIVVPLAGLLWIVRSWLQAGDRSPFPLRWQEVVRYLVPVVVGILSITSLTTVDVIVAKAALSDHDAGLYSGASLIGRVILYLPAAIVTVLLPKVSARAASGGETAEMLKRSLLVTGGFCVAAIVLYATLPRLLVLVAFGGKFEDAADLLWLFAIAMSGFALVNVLLAYHLGRGEAAFSWILLAGATVQAGFLAAFHDSAREILAVNIGVSVSLLLAHEAMRRASLVAMLRASPRRS